MKDKEPRRFVFTVGGALTAAQDDNYAENFRQAGADPYYATKYLEYLGEKFPQEFVARYELTDYLEPQKPVKRLVVGGKVTNGPAST